MASYEVEGTSSGDKDSDTLPVDVGEAKARLGLLCKAKGKPSRFLVGKQPQSDHKFLAGPLRDPFKHQKQGCIAAASARK